MQVNTSTWHLLMDLVQRHKDIMTIAGQVVAQEKFTRALQLFDEAKELLIQMREIGFWSGVGEVVTMANNGLKRLEENINFTRSVQALAHYNLILETTLNMPAGSKVQ